MPNFRTLILNRCSYSKDFFFKSNPHLNDLKLKPGPNEYRNAGEIPKAYFSYSYCLTVLLLMKPCNPPSTLEDGAGGIKDNYRVNAAQGAD